jgi:hypothetical protein
MILAGWVVNLELAGLELTGVDLELDVLLVLSQIRASDGSPRSIAWRGRASRRRHRGRTRSASAVKDA